jgi:hypothetical protein
VTEQQTRAQIWMQAYRPDASVRPIEVATAAAFTMLAMALRWAPSRPGGSALQQTAISSAAWVRHAWRPTPRQLFSAAFAGCAVGLFIGGSGGLFCGLLAAVGVLTFGSRRVSDHEARSRMRLVAAAPPVVDLFAAGLAAGLLPADAAAAAATAFITPAQTSTTYEPTPSEPAAAPTLPAPHASRFKRFHPRRLNPRPTPPSDPTLEIAERFAAAAQALREGADPETAWHPLAVDGATAPVAAAALRASRTGAPASETVAKAARDLWTCAEHAAQAQLRSTAVRAAMPLALCFLPAFVLLGIVPTMIGVLAQLRA